MDGMGWYPGGRGYRAPYGANNNNINQLCHDQSSPMEIMRDKVQYQ